MRKHLLFTCIIACLLISACATVGPTAVRKESSPITGYYHMDKSWAKKGGIMSLGREKRASKGLLSFIDKSVEELDLYLKVEKDSLREYSLNQGKWTCYAYPIRNEGDSLIYRDGQNTRVVLKKRGEALFNGSVTAAGWRYRLVAEEEVPDVRSELAKSIRAEEAPLGMRAKEEELLNLDICELSIRTIKNSNGTNSFVSKWPIEIGNSTNSAKLILAVTKDADLALMLDLGKEYCIRAEHRSILLFEDGSTDSYFGNEGGRSCDNIWMKRFNETAAEKFLHVGIEKIRIGSDTGYLDLDVQSSMRQEVIDIMNCLVGKSESWSLGQ